MKKRFSLVLILLTLSLLVLPACALTKDLKGAGDVGKEFMNALKNSDYQASWNLVTPDIQTEIGGYSNWVDFATIRNFSDFSFSSTNVENDQATLDGEATLAGDTYKVQLILTKSGDNWLVAGIDFSLK